MSLDERILAIEHRLILDRTNAAAHVRQFNQQARRRVTSPTSLLFASGMGFVTAEVIRMRKGKPGGLGKALKSLLGPAASVLRKVLIFV